MYQMCFVEWDNDDVLYMFCVCVWGEEVGRLNCLEGDIKKMVEDVIFHLVYTMVRSVYMRINL